MEKYLALFSLITATLWDMESQFGKLEFLFEKKNLELSKMHYAIQIVFSFFTFTPVSRSTLIYMGLKL